MPTPKEGELEVARSELWLSIAELEKLTVRAPIASTVLQVNVKVGEVAGPTASQPLMLLGDLSRLRVRAELDEHDVGKIAEGDKAVVTPMPFAAASSPARLPPLRRSSGWSASVRPSCVSLTSA